MEACGCEVIRETNEYSDIDDHIAYCPKHQAVDRLLKAAKEARLCIRGLGLSCENRIEIAIAAAEGKASHE